jgi:hypothetical protein
MGRGEVAARVPLPLHGMSRPEQSKGDAATISLKENDFTVDLLSLDASI